MIVIFLMKFSEKPIGSWADGMLRALDYDNHPENVHEIIRQIYKHATEEIKEVRKGKAAFLLLISNLSDPSPGEWSEGHTYSIL